MQLFLVADLRGSPDTGMARKDRLIARLLSKPRDFTWAETCTLMKGCGFDLENRRGSRRMFIHVQTQLKVGMHEPHSRPALLPYELDLLIDGLKNVGEIKNDQPL
jgi:hypothetical protein